MSKLDPKSKRLSANWSKLDVVEQMANIGSEIHRAISWQHKNKEYSLLANDRALELFDLTKTAKTYPQLREICRARELWLDFFIGPNQYHQTAAQWHSYFTAFNFAARNPLWQKKTVRS